MATTLKLQLGDDIRRLNISQLTTYTDFSKLVREVFNIPALNGIQMSYQDEEKDWINIRSEMDMAEARAYAARLPSFKITLTVNNALSHSPEPAEPNYPQLAPEDIDLTSSFADLMTDSMQMEKKADPEAQTAPSHLAIPFLALPTASPSAPVGQVSANQEAAAQVPPEVVDNVEALHKSLDELSAAQDEKNTEAGIGVLTSVEGKLKKALDALVQFMESLKLDDKMKKIVLDLEPSFAKFEASFIQPLEQFSQRASHNIQTEIQEFQVQVNDFKDRLQHKLEEIRSRPNTPVPSRAHTPPSAAPVVPAPVVPAPVPSAPAPEPHHNAMQDLQTLESMGFNDRRRNLELLAAHQGNIALVIDRLLADAQ